MTLQLRGYQREAIAAVESAYARGVTRPLVALPTGSGKTIIFSHLIDQRPGRALVVAHRTELIEQAAAKLRQIQPGAEIGIVKGERDEYNAPIVVASVQTLSRPNRLERIGLCDFATVICDEAHHATADTYRRVLGHVGSFLEPAPWSPNVPLTLGVTATAERGDKVALGEVWQEIVYEKPLLEMMEAHYLCDLRAIQVHLAADFNSLHTRAGDFIDSEMEEMLLDANAPEHAVEAYREHAPGRKALVFTPTVKTAHLMAKAFNAAGIAAAAVDGGTPIDERRVLLQRFDRGELRILANCAVLTEGYDCPSVDCIIMARPTKSRPFFMQMIGRGTRTHPGKADCIILDLVGSTSRHDLMTTATLFGLDPDDIEERGVSGAVAAQREVAEQQAAQGRLLARTVNLFEQHKFHWVPASGNRFILSLGTRMLVLTPEGETWTVQQLVQGKGDVLATGLSLEWAQGVAEDIARESKAERLIDPHAPWRQRPASEKQLAALRRCRIRVRPGLTSGEASDLIAAALAGAGR